MLEGNGECQGVKLCNYSPDSCEFLSNYYRQLKALDFEEILMRFEKIGNTIRNELFSIDFFAKRIDEDIKVYSLYRDNVIIDGARLPIEIDYFKDKYSNVYSIRVIRSDYDNELNLKEKSDETEVALDNYSNYDYTIINDGSLSDLRDKVDKCLESLL